MSTTDRGVWKSLERHSATAFLVAGTMFVIDAGIVGFAMTGGGDQVMLLGQAFIAGGWTAGFIGLLGMYPDLADRSPRLAQVGVVLVSIGIVVFTLMGVASVAFYSGVVSGDLTPLVPLFLPGVILGSVLGFLTFGTTILRTDSRARRVGILVIVLSLFPVVNIGTGIAGVQSMTLTLAIVVGLAVVNLAIGYLIRSTERSTEYTEPETANKRTA